MCGGGLLLTGNLSKIPEEGLRNLAIIFLRADTPLKDIKVGPEGAGADHDVEVALA